VGGSESRSRATATSTCRSGRSPRRGDEGLLVEGENLDGPGAWSALLSPIPVFYAYFIGYLGHANGFPDQNTATGGADLSTGGAYLIRKYRSQLIAGLYAGTVSAYLMKVVNGLDPEKVPPPAFVAAHTRILWQAQIRFDPDSSEPPPPLTLPQPSNQEIGVVLGRTAPEAVEQRRHERDHNGVPQACKDVAVVDDKCGGHKGQEPAQNTDADMVGKRERRRPDSDRAT
jgi:hypothetical protein